MDVMINSMAIFTGKNVHLVTLTLIYSRKKKLLFMVLEHYLLENIAASLHQITAHTLLCLSVSYLVCCCPGGDDQNGTLGQNAHHCT